MADMYGNYDKADAQETDVVKLMNKISMAFSGLSNETVFKDEEKAAAFGAYSTLYLQRTFGTEILQAILEKFSVFELAFAYCVSLDDTGEMSDEKALVDEMRANGMIGDSRDLQEELE